MNKFAQIAQSHFSETIAFLTLQVVWKFPTVWSEKHNHHNIDPSKYFKTTLRVKMFTQKSVFIEPWWEKATQGMDGSVFVVNLVGT